MMTAPHRDAVTAVATSAAACSLLHQQSKTLANSEAVAVLQDALEYADGHGGVVLGPLHASRLAVLQDLFAAQSAGKDRRAAIATGLRLQSLLDAVFPEVCPRRGLLASVLAKLYMFEEDTTMARHWAEVALPLLQKTFAPGADIVLHMHYILADTTPGNC